MQDRELKTIDEKTILANMAVMGDKITKMRG
jgi:hypothetical protein